MDDVLTRKDQFAFGLKAIIAFLFLISDALMGRIDLTTQVRRIERPPLVQVKNSPCSFILVVAFNASDLKRPI